MSLKCVQVACNTYVCSYIRRLQIQVCKNSCTIQKCWYIQLPDGIYYHRPSIHQCLREKYYCCWVKFFTWLLWSLRKIQRYGNQLWISTRVYLSDRCCNDCVAAIAKKALGVEWEFTVSVPGASKITVRVLKITEKYRYWFCPSNVRTFNRVARMTTSNDGVWSQLPGLSYGT